MSQSELDHFIGDLKHEEINREQMCRELCKLNNIHWHKWERSNKSEIHITICECGEILTDYNDNPTFSHPEEILEIMKKRNDYDNFINNELQFTHWLGIDEFIDQYILNPSKLLIVAWKWSKENV